MKTLLFFLLLFSTQLEAQKFHYARTKSVIAVDKIRDQWKADDNGHVTYVVVMDSLELTRDEIYSRALAFFTYNYKSGEDVVQISDKESGQIIGKGIYSSVGLVANYSTDTWHTLTVDIKEGRARATLSLTGYKLKSIKNLETLEYHISQTYPVNRNSVNPGGFATVFLESHNRALATMALFQKSLRENKEW